MITFNYEQTDFKLKQKLLLKRWIKSVIESYSFRLGDISYIFCDDKYILSVNRQYLQHNYYTDIITFDYVEGGRISGDLFISIDTVTSNSSLYNSSFIDELHRVMIHGVLHLCGLKDKSPEDEKSMRAAEDSALKMLSNILDEK